MLRLINRASRRHVTAFTLVEVAVAMAVFVFAGLALIGLLSLGLQQNRDSKDQLQAASIAESICTTLRATPTSNFTSSTYPQSGFPIASITNTVSPTTAYLAWDGTTTNQANARFGLIYSVKVPASYNPMVSPSKATVYMCFFWPALANPTNYTTGRLEMSTAVALP